MKKGLTTHEDCKYVYDAGQGSPFSLFSYCANLKHTVFRIFSKSLFNPELLYKPEEEREKVRENLNKVNIDERESVSLNKVQAVIGNRKANERNK